MSDKKTEFFFSYKNGNSRQVTKEEWEREWLNWWRKNNPSSTDEEALKEV